MLTFQLMTKLLKHSHNTGLLNLPLHIEKQLFYSRVKNWLAFVLCLSLSSESNINISSITVMLPICMPLMVPLD